MPEEQPPSHRSILHSPLAHGPMLDIAEDQVLYDETDEDHSK